MLAMGYYSGVGKGFGFGGIAPDLNAACSGNDGRFQGSPAAPARARKRQQEDKEHEGLAGDWFVRERIHALVPVVVVVV